MQETQMEKTRMQASWGRQTRARPARKDRSRLLLFRLVRRLVDFVFQGLQQIEETIGDGLRENIVINHAQALADLIRESRFRRVNPGMDRKRLDRSGRHGG